jgi:hypothetical protein
MDHTASVVRRTAQMVSMATEMAALSKAAHNGNWRNQKNVDKFQRTFIVTRGSSVEKQYAVSFQFLFEAGAAFDGLPGD